MLMYEVWCLEVCGDALGDGSRDMVDGGLGWGKVLRSCIGL